MSNQDAVPPKKRKTVQEDWALEQLKKMGYAEGKGLGAQEQGIREPVAASTQIGRSGLGLSASRSSGAYQATDIEWTEGADVMESDADTDFTWFAQLQHELLPQPLPESWIQTGPRKNDISQETQFCEPAVLNNVLQCKTVFDEVAPRAMLDARTRSNPFETIKNGIFMNRAAMKMANMDAITDFCFTNIAKPDQLLYFADICAGPGGFTEYMLWRRQLTSRGFGFTLRGDNDFKLDAILAGPVECFSTHYGVHGDGDVYKDDNLTHFVQEVHSETDNQGVHVVLADGGFSVEGQENIQEILSKQLYLCQFIFALALLRPGGHFVCKLFDTFTAFSVGLIFLVGHAFKEFAVVKPVTSRPANSERYIIFREFLGDHEGPVKASSILTYLRKVNAKINQLKETDVDVIRLLPDDKMLSTDYLEYIVELNNKYGHQQAIALAKIKAFVRDTNLLEYRSGEIRQQCLEMWKVPDSPRMNSAYPLQSQFPSAARELLHDDENGAMRNPYSELLPHVDSLMQAVAVKDSFNPYCHCVFLGGNEEPFLFYSRGMGEAYVATSDMLWQPWSKNEKSKNRPAPRIPAGTLLWVWPMREYTCKGQSHTRQFHILDSPCVYGRDLRKLPFHERRQVIEQMLSALTPHTIPMRYEAQPQQKQTTTTVKGRRQPASFEKLRRQGPDTKLVEDGEEDAGSSNQGAAAMRRPAVFKMAVCYELAHLVANHEEVFREHVRVQKAKNISLPSPMWFPKGIFYQDGDKSVTFFHLQRALIMKNVKEPWIIGWSRSAHRRYYFNVVSRGSLFERPPESIAPFGAYHLLELPLSKASLHESSTPMETKSDLNLHVLLDMLKKRVPSESV